jgi:MoaA/NifB/PqqE/SkfB family radical SAM enzyme
MLQELPAPRSLIAVPTFRCPLRCRHCDLPLHQRDELEAGLWRERILELSGQVERPFLVGISGGEPLAYPGIHPLVAACSEVGFHTALATSAGPLAPDTIGPLLAQGLTALVVSLDGTPEVHDHLRRRRGLYHHAVAAMAAVRRMSPELSITVVTTVMGPTVGHLLPLARRVAESPDVTSICFHTLSANLGSEAELDPRWYRHSALWPRDLPALREELLQLVELGEAGELPLVNSADQLRQMIAFFEAPERQLRPCDQHSGGMMVLPDGQVKICPIHDPVASVVDHAIVEVWQSAPVRALREEMVSCRRNCHFMTNHGYQRHELRS